MDELATDKQLALLDRRGIEYPDGITKYAASKLIDSIMPAKTSAVRDVTKQFPAANPGKSKDDDIHNQVALYTAVDVVKGYLNPNQPWLEYKKSFIEAVKEMQEEFNKLL